MEIYDELVFMFGRALDIEVSNLDFSRFGDENKTTLLRVYEKDVVTSVLTVNLGRMRVTSNSPRSMRLDEQTKDTLISFMETDYYAKKIADKEKSEGKKKIKDEKPDRKNYFAEFLDKKGLTKEFINFVAEKYN